MDSFCDEASMGAAEMISDPHTPASASEARMRINDARVSEVAFVVRKIVAGRLDDDDVILLATVLAHAVDRQLPITKSYVEAELKAAGRSTLRASQLAGAIIK